MGEDSPVDIAPFGPGFGTELPGWGTEPNEEGLRAHPPKSMGGLLNYGQKAR